MKHPSEWLFGGYNEILSPPRRYTLINQQTLVGKSGAPDSDQFRHDYKHWVEEVPFNRSAKRSARWTESIAVGNEEFVEGIKMKLGFKAEGRNVDKSDGFFTLKESQIPYSTVFAPPKKRNS